MPQHSFPITLTGFAAIVAACIVIMRTGLRKSILNPYLFVWLSCFRVFAFLLDDPECAPIADLANGLAFSCITVLFFWGISRSSGDMTYLLRQDLPTSPFVDSAPCTARAGNSQGICSFTRSLRCSITGPRAVAGDSGLPAT